ncbi:hypothetical protein LTR78_002315 [Recurvomyces mirabilis]|uniref:Uncharacterized protein n=1 Tax=Recurvomyces mirabilis TaxID=574656 RepID=A0AAE0WV78_9PEZI|nr:hypothetical protein LTR78_002315 [Recurvomyces mirabilis]KAK5160770.1 hypothetical protein LTS14_001783 [Recurvomyces mirabilis]
MPIEIRLQIYAFIFASSKHITISKDHAIPPKRYPPLLPTCKKLHNEAYQEFLAHIAFGANSTKEASSWLRNLPQQYVTKIRQLRIASIKGIQSPLDRHWNPSHRCQVRHVGRGGARGTVTTLWGPLSSSPPTSSNHVAEWRQNLIDEIRGFTKTLARYGLPSSAVLVALPMPPLDGRAAWVGIEDLIEGLWEKKQVLEMVWFVSCSVHASTGNIR